MGWWNGLPPRVRRWLKAALAAGLLVLAACSSPAVAAGGTQANAGGAPPAASPTRSAAPAAHAVTPSAVSTVTTPATADHVAGTVPFSALATVRRILQHDGCLTSDVSYQPAPTSFVVGLRCGWPDKDVYWLVAATIYKTPAMQAVHESTVKSQAGNTEQFAVLGGTLEFVYHAPAAGAVTKAANEIRQKLGLGHP